MIHDWELAREELAEALARRRKADDAVDEARERVQAAKEVLREALDAQAAVEKTVREIEGEILTGLSSVPLIASAQARNGAAPLPPSIERAARDLGDAIADEMQKEEPRLIPRGRKRKAVAK